MCHPHQSLPHHTLVLSVQSRPRLPLLHPRQLYVLPRITLYGRIATVQVTQSAVDLTTMVLAPACQVTAYTRPQVSRIASRSVTIHLAVLRSLLLVVTALERATQNLPRAPSSTAVLLTQLSKSAQAHQSVQAQQVRHTWMLKACRMASYATLTILATI